MSRQSYPKPFIRLSDGTSLIQHALKRAAAIPGVVDILTITNRDLVFEVKDQYAETGTQGLRHHFLLEPEGRDTAAAIAIAALEIERALGGAHVMCIFPGDHIIADLPAFVERSKLAIELAADHRLVTLGIEPDRPETGYGYIETSGTDVVRFVEKPTLERAEAFLESGRFLWNAGIFFCEAETMIALMERHCPDILAASRDALSSASRLTGSDFSQVELRPDDFGKVRKDSIDYAVLEKASDLAVVACDVGWSDVGSWQSFAKLTPPDSDGNTFLGDVVTIDTRNSYIRSESRLVTALGVENLVIVDTPDALLVASANRTEDVKKLFNMLKALDHEAHHSHRRVQRPWGNYTVLETGPRFKIKRIEVKPSGRLSLQMHHHRSEHWVVVAGRAKVVNGDRELMLEPDQSTYIPCGSRHRLENPDETPLILIEVQTGEYLEEDDIVRFEDVYGRQVS